MSEPRDSSPKNNAKLAASLAVLVLGMVMLSFAAVPLYNMFCRITGYGGTTQVSLAAPEQVLERQMTVRFNTDVEKDLPWQFTADQGAVQVKIGEERLVSFTAENTGDEPVYGTAIYNVTPILPLNISVKSNASALIRNGLTRSRKCICQFRSISTRKSWMTLIYGIWKL